MLQPQIVVTREHKWVEQQLQQLIGPFATVAVKSDGLVALIASPNDVKTSPGVKLLERLLESAHTITINPYSQDEEDEGAKNRPDNNDNALIPGVGSGSTIRIGKGTQKSLVLKAGKLLPEDTQPWLILGHELIHADRAARGAKTTGTVDYQVKGNWKDNLISGTYTSKTEEAQTVGLMVGNDVTENSIRSYHNLPSVAIYETQYEDWLKIEIQKQKFAKQKTVSSTGKPFAQDF